MNGHVSTADDVVVVGESLPRIRSAHRIGGRKVLLTFRSGETRIVDLAPALASRRIYLPLRDDDALFSTLRVSELGDAIEWRNGLDFSAIWLARLPNIEFANADFRDAMDALEMSLDGMAAELGISRRLVAAYRKDKPIPRHIAFATRYLVENSGRGTAL